MSNPLDKMDTNIAIQEHDSKCKEEWRACDCPFAMTIRRLRGETKGGEPEKSESTVPLPNILDDLEHKRRVYLNNVGLSIVHRNIKDLSDEQIFDKIHLLDQATRDECFKRIRKARNDVQDTINRLRAIAQGMYIGENQLLQKLSDSERLNQMRKDKTYKIAAPKNIGDATKKEKKKQSTEEKLKAMGIDLKALQAEATVRMGTAAQKKDSGQ